MLRNVYQVVTLLAERLHVRVRHLYPALQIELVATPVKLLKSFYLTLSLFLFLTLSLSLSPIKLLKSFYLTLSLFLFLSLSLSLYYKTNDLSWQNLT